MGKVTRYGYNANTNILEWVQYPEDTASARTEYTYDCDNSGALATVYDSETGISTTYYYDFTDRMMKYVEEGTDYSHSVGYEYDTINNLTSMVETINGVKHTTTYTYDGDNRLQSKTTDGIKESYSYDYYGRVADVTTGFMQETYWYNSAGNSTSSGQVSTYMISAGNYDVTFIYTYDDNGNILSVSDGTYTTTYQYDSANQLIRENNQQAGKTWTWEYDNAGNILSKNEFAYSTDTLGDPNEWDVRAYTYTDSDWGDLMTSCFGDVHQYDAIGNLVYDGYYDYTWQHGRELLDMEESGTVYANTYDANGMRTKRIVYERDTGEVYSTYTYVYNGSQLVQMTVDGNTLYFTYDASGSPQTVKYNSTTYYYVTNLQGDVIAILNGNGDTVVSYSYDAWGNHTSGIYGTGTLASTLGKHNPLHYRGYVYDVGTGLYYLQSRFYCPYTGRFINADDFAYLGADNTLLSYNLFAYCNNAPVCFRDPSGKSPSGMLNQIMANLKNQILSSVSLIVDIVLNPPSKEEMALASTVYTEAAGQNNITKRAVAHVIKNRVGTRNSWKNILDVISAPSQFSGYNNAMYQDAMHFYNTKIHNNEIERRSMSECLIIAVLVNRGVLHDITQGALYFHSLPKPEDWRYHYDYTQVYIAGTERFWFYK